MAWTDNLLWDAAIEADPDVAIGTGFPGPDGECASEVLYRPGELLVERELWEADGHPLVDELRRSGAVPIGEVPRDRRDVERAEVASDLGLQLVYLRHRDPLGLLRDARDAGILDLELASLNHVIAGSPQRHGGDTQPMPVRPEDVLQIPAVGAAGENVRVGVLDTGIVEPAPFGTENRGPQDQEVIATFPPGPYGVAVGHGTLVAGVIARYAPGATRVVRRVLHTPGGVADETEVAAALGQLPTNLKILNASFSGFSVDSSDTMKAFKLAVQNVQANGTLVVAAVGNQASENKAYMAGFPDVIGVASVEGAAPSQLQLAAYSNRGGYVKLCAHGTDVVSTYVTGQARVSGTSFAAPKVTAAVAAIMSRDNIVDPHAAAAKLLAGPVSVPKAGVYVDPQQLPA
jgi:subtilisin family serine protease